MTTYRQDRKWTHRIVFAMATVAIGTGVLELVAGAMKFENPDTMAVRVQVLAAQSERAHRIRTLEQGQLRLAARESTSGL